MPNLAADASRFLSFHRDVVGVLLLHCGLIRASPFIIIAGDQVALLRYTAKHSWICSHKVTFSYGCTLTSSSHFLHSMSIFSGLHGYCLAYFPYTYFILYLIIPHPLYYISSPITSQSGFSCMPIGFWFPCTFFSSAIRFATL